MHEKFEIEEAHDKQVAVVYLDNPKINALSKKVVEELNDLLQVLYKGFYRVVIFSNRGKVFCAGADLKERQKMSENETAIFVRWVRETFYRIYTLPTPTICAMQGSALGGGLEWSLACDYRIASDENSYGLPETSLGIIPGAGGTQYLSGVIGPTKAMEFIFSAKKVNGIEAASMGIVNISVPREEVLNKALEVAAGWCENAPLALKYAKRAIQEGWGIEEELLRIEEKWYNQTIPTADRKEALKAFLEKRKPNWKGK